MKKSLKALPKTDDLGLPVDPSTNPQSIMGDTSGLSGMTVGKAEHADRAEVVENDQESSSPVGKVSIHDPAVQQKIDRQEEVGMEVGGDTLEANDFGKSRNETLTPHAPPHIVGQHSVSGTMPDPNADNDTLANSHHVGIRLDEDEDHPRELNIAADVAAAEKRRRG